jgi:hypothetical protein
MGLLLLILPDGEEGRGEGAIAGQQALLTAVSRLHYYFDTFYQAAWIYRPIEPCWLLQAMLWQIPFSRGANGTR